MAPTTRDAMLSIIFYVPEADLEKVKDAMFTAGAGRMGNYDRCCWQTKGLGQFRPLAGSDPSIGEHGKQEQVDEWKVEMVCEPAKIGAVLSALKAAHPYETPAFLVMEPKHF